MAEIASKVIEGHENYLIYEDGSIYSKIRKKFLKSQLIRGELSINLNTKDNFSSSLVSKLVAEAFIPNPKNYTQIIYLDGDKTNVSAYNLKWVSDEEYIGLLEGEIWKDLPSQEKYKISNKGRILLKGNKIKKKPILIDPIIKNNNRKHFKIKNSNTSFDSPLDILVAKTFIPNPKNLPYVKYLDGNFLNCESDNLKWVDDEEYVGTLEGEIWKDINFGVIVDYNYKISNKGRVLSKGDENRRPKILEPKLSSRYVSYSLNKNKECFYLLANRMVALLFVPNPNNYNELIHIDGNIFNNSSDNLKWVSDEEYIGLLEGEIWKDVEDFPLFRVSNKGRIYRKRISFDIMGTKTPGSGYTKTIKPSGGTVTLYDGKRRTTKILKKLIAEAFVPNPNNYRYVSHVNGDLEDNRAENLIWSEHREVVLF